jgi:hypothetical protein
VAAVDPERCKVHSKQIEQKLVAAQFIFRGTSITQEALQAVNQRHSALQRQELAKYSSRRDKYLPLGHLRVG